MKLAIKILTNQIEHLQSLINTGNFFTQGNIKEKDKLKKRCKKDITKLRKAIKVLREVKE